MKKTFFSFALVIPFVSINLFAGGSIVRNGGGMAEMLAVMMFQKMERSLSVCLNPQNPCGLTPPQVKILHQVTQSLPLEHQAYDLEFFSSTTGSEIVRTGRNVGSPLLIRSSAIADENGNPRPLAIIGASVLYGLLLHQNMDSMTLANAVFAQTQSSTRTFHLNGGELLVIQYKNRSGFLAHELALEQEDRSYDLNSLINTVGFCQNDQNLNYQVLSINRPLPSMDDVIFDVKWNCGGNSFGKAKVQLSLTYDQKGHLNLAESKAKGFALQYPD